MKDSTPVIGYCLMEQGKTGCDASNFCRDTLSRMDTNMYAITHQVLYFYFLIKMVVSITSRLGQDMIFTGLSWKTSGRSNYTSFVQENPSRVFDISEDN